jgi:glycine/D-amino acid oxidase-like deaminating enzyme
MATPAGALECWVVPDRHHMQTADVVIVGGGIVGSSIAYHLTANGCRNVLVIERESNQGKGSTGKSMGGVRAQFSTPVSIQMSLYSIPFYAEFEERVGYPCDYRPQGYLFCATSDKQMAYLRTNYTQQVKLGLKNVRLIAGEEIRQHVSAAARGRHCRRKFLLHRRLRRSVQRDERIHDLGSRSRRNIVEEHSP